MNFKLSEIDEERFEIKVAKAEVTDVDQALEALDRCRANDVRLLIARTPTASNVALNTLEQAGGQLMDTAVTWGRELDASHTVAPTLRTRVMVEADTEAIVAIAAASFRDHGGHYHADPLLDRKRCQEVYSSWARNCCAKTDAADEVIVAESHGEVVGFYAVRLHEGMGQGVISGVASESRGAGLFRALSEHCLIWSREAGAPRMLAATQVWNLAVQRAWTHLGFRPTSSEYVAHVWFD